MALSEYQIQLVFEVFDIPQAESVLYIDGAFATGKTSQTGAILVSKDEIRTLIAGISAEQEQRVVELLTEWSRVSLSSVRVKPQPSNEGVDVNPARTRALIRQRLQKIIPIVRPEELTGSGGGYIPLG